MLHKVFPCAEEIFQTVPFKPASCSSNPLAAVGSTSNKYKKAFYNFFFFGGEVDRGHQGDIILINFKFLL